MTKACFQCGRKGADLFGYCVCDSCKAKLGLFTDATIKRHIAKYETQGKSYAEEINNRLHILDEDYIKKKIKLLHVRERLQHI
ncbi:hypothetical protein AAU61_14040 [Desulfocarbo indianensis]|nr:hypothetical protein AAU61_14040 [Desulfocarbo indianensis]